MDEAVALAEELATKPAVALAAAKYAVNQAADPSRLLGLEYERELWGLLFDTDDQKEGMKAFLEKRPAQFPDQRDWTRRRPEFPWERPGNPLEVAKEEVYLPTKDASTGSGPASRNGPFDMLSMAETYREAGLRAFQAFFAIMRNATDSYRFWADVALQDRSAPPRNERVPRTAGRAGPDPFSQRPRAARPAETGTRESPPVHLWRELDQTRSVPKMSSSATGLAPTSATSRGRWGGLLWVVAAIQFVIGMIVTQLGWTTSYSLITNYISDLGAVNCGYWPAD